MASCLGLYIEENIIKYAKVTKDSDVIKIDSFGIKFYDMLNEAIDQVIQETYSYKTPISINLSNEVYNYFNVFNLLSKRDMHSYIKTEFESICFEKDLKASAYETRYVLVDDIENPEKVKAIHISTGKGELTNKFELFSKYKLIDVSPIGIDIANLIEISKTENIENIAIVNIDDLTTVTTIISQKIYDVKTIEFGTKEILSKIKAKENSYAKAYEICKNSTIYTNDGKELQYEENSYLDDIMPTLYNIVGRVKKILNDSVKKIDKIYITGTASVINNIDIYFQDYLEDVKCEILKPYFIKNIGADVNMKDYIEVNSALALALQGLDCGLKGINFKKETVTDKLPEWMNVTVSPGENRIIHKLEEKGFSFSLKGELKPTEKSMISGAVAVVMLIAIYSGITLVLHDQMVKKREEVALQDTVVTQQAAEIKADTTKVDEKTGEYTELIQELEDVANENNVNKTLKYSIPTLLSQIMSVTPTGVQLKQISIDKWEDNITRKDQTKEGGCKVTIEVESYDYDQIGIFAAKLKADGILEDADTNRSERESPSDPITAQIGGIIP